MLPMQKLNSEAAVDLFHYRSNNTSKVQFFYTEYTRQRLPICKYVGANRSYQIIVQQSTEPVECFHVCRVRVI
jgi:hypothetical protein